MTPVGALKYAMYLARGRRPFTTGYGVYKARRVAEVLARGGFNVACLPRGYGRRLDERIVEYPWLFSRLPGGPGRLLDAGSALNFDYVLLQPALRQKRIVISTLSPDAEAPTRHQDVSYVYEDLRETCFKSDYFDWVVCLSTLEHVGLDNTRFYTGDPSKKQNQEDAYLTAAAELERVVKPGGRLFLSMPYGERRNHGWLQVFDAAMLDSLLTVLSPAEHQEHYFRYTAEGWQASSREGARNATYFDYHAARRHDPDFAAAARAVVCIEAVKDHA